MRHARRGYRLQESAHHPEPLVRSRKSRLPMVAGGDFNAEPGSEVHKRLLAAGLRDAWMECGGGDGFTYPADKPIKRIDYLFLTGSLRCTSARVIDTGFPITARCSSRFGRFSEPRTAARAPKRQCRGRAAAAAASPPRAGRLRSAHAPWRAARR